MNKLTLRRRTSTPKAREFNPQSNCHNLQTNDMHALTDRPQLNDNHGPCPMTSTMELIWKLRIHLRVFGPCVEMD